MVALKTVMCKSIFTTVKQTPEILPSEYANSLREYPKLTVVVQRWKPKEVIKEHCLATRFGQK
jgi:hypothetical protein